MFVCQYSDRSYLVNIYYEYFCLLTWKQITDQPNMLIKRFQDNSEFSLSTILLELHIEFSLEVCICVFLFTG